MPIVLYFSGLTSDSSMACWTSGLPLPIRPPGQTLTTSLSWRRNFLPAGETLGSRPGVVKGNLELSKRLLFSRLEGQFLDSRFTSVIVTQLDVDLDVLLVAGLVQNGQDTGVKATRVGKAAHREGPLAKLVLRQVGNLLASLPGDSFLVGLDADQELTLDGFESHAAVSFPNVRPR